MAIFPTPFKNERIENILLFWAFLYSDSTKRVNLLLDIHPMKCFPTLYTKSNENYCHYPIPIEKNHGVTLSGCPRYTVNIAKKEYPGNQPLYCSAFGLPDDCYSSQFGKKFLDKLDNFKKSDIWLFEKNGFIENYCPNSIPIHYMKEEFLPKQCFFYNDSSSKFLSGLFHSPEISSINANFWYSNGKDFIKERNYLKSGHNFRFEEYTLDIVKEKATYELIRLLLLLKHQDQFQAFSIGVIPKYDENAKISADTSIRDIVEQIKFDYQTRVNRLLGAIELNLNLTRLKTSNFLVMDTEFITVFYPAKITNKDARSFKFPCIFVSIIWNGQSRIAEIDINVLTLPCHYCIEKCREIKKHSLKFNCVYFVNPFIAKQTNFFEENLVKVPSFKIYSYGKGDFKQLEHSDNFFINSNDARVYYRRNRKKPLSLVKLAQDISIEGTSLTKIEKDILQKWIIGWSRYGDHVNVNRNFTTHISRADFTKRYTDAIETCVSDSLSAFLYLLYRDYRLNDEPIKLEKSIKQHCCKQCLSIPTLPRHNPPHPAFTIPDIPNIPGDHMAVAVHHGLAARFAHVEPDVVAVRPGRFLDYLFAFTDEINGCPPLIIRHRKESGKCRNGIMRRWPWLTGNCPQRA